MKLTTNIRSLAIGLLTAVLLAACGKSDDSDNAFADTDSLLRYVPADTSYVVARLEPLPAAFRKRVEPHNALVRETNREMFEALLEQEIDDADSAEAQKMRQIIRRMMDLISGDGLAKAGIAVDGPFVAYGARLLPVVRFELNDADAYGDFIDALAAELELTLEPASIGAVSYRRADFGELQLLLHSDATTAVVALARADLAEPELAATLGFELPAENIAAAGTLARVVANYDFLDSTLGYVSFVQLVDDFADLAPAMAANDETDATAPVFDETCRREIKRVVSGMPRMLVGIRRADANGIASSTVFELREDIAKDLSGLAAPVPGLGTLESDVATFGMSFDAKVARAFAEKRAAAVVESPFECRFLQGFNDGALQVSEFLKRQPLPPTAYDFKGFVIALDSFDGMLTNAASVTANFRALIAIDNAESLMALGNMFVPEIAALNLKPDGEVVRLSTERLGATDIDAWVSMKKNAIGLAAGPDGAAQLRSLMTLKPNVDAPLLHMNIDAAAYLRLVRQGMSTGAGSAAEQAILGNVNVMLDSLAELYDRLTVDVVTSEHGIELRSDVSLKPR